MHRREKLFGLGRSVPLDRNAKARIMALAKALMWRTAKGKHYGAITAKACHVLEALIYQFHNSGNGRCFPSYDTIADRAGCSRSMVWRAIHMLESAGILTWVNRLYRTRSHCPHGSGWRWMVMRTSNGYRFYDPISSKFKFPTGTTNQQNNNNNWAIKDGPTGEFDTKVAKSHNPQSHFGGCLGTYHPEITHG